MNTKYDIIVVGGGAAGFFAAINIAENNATLKIAILERGKEVLSKVRVSGGGRCNVTHSCFVPNELVTNYPRGEKELRGPFHLFAAGDTIAWFEKHGVTLKTEEDGRMFPVSNSSQTIIDCFLSVAAKYKIDILKGQSVQSLFLHKKENTEFWKVETNIETFGCQHLLMATGSNPKVWERLEKLGHSIIHPVPSLFTFNIKDTRIKDLMGVSTLATVQVKDTKLSASGPLLITHWGMSGPAILRLSAWGARILHDKNYQFSIQINWLNHIEKEEVEELLKELKLSDAKKTVAKRSPFEIPNRLWESIVIASTIDIETKWADLTKNQLKALQQELTSATYIVNGKSTFKDEFVTAGGINLKEVNFKTMESKLHSNLYFAGEILNIDAITGGFNFQNAWTTAFIVAQTILKKQQE